jgi:hypothetical protein
MCCEVLKIAKNVFEKYACLSGMQCIALYEQANGTNFRRLIKCMTSFPIFTFIQSMVCTFFLFVANKLPVAMAPVTLRVIIFNALLFKYPE